MKSDGRNDMKNKKLMAVALVCAALASTAVAGIVVLGIEVLGIEVLGIEVLGIEVLGIEVLSTGAPAGSMVEAKVNNGIEVLTVDIQPVDPLTGLSHVNAPVMPAGWTGQIELRDPAGNLLALTGFDPTVQE